jgi:SAM-dependent methyltransferase
VVSLECKSVQFSDYLDIAEDVHRLLEMVPRCRGLGHRIEIPHEHRYWEYGSALAAGREHFEKTDFASTPVLLDLGCGYSPLGPTVRAKSQWQVVENDLTEEIMKARGSLYEALGRPLMTFLKGDLCVIDHPAEFVTCMSVMEHLSRDQQEKGWRALAKNVKPGGLLVATVDYADDKDRDWTFDRDRETKFGPDDVEGVISLLEEEGFEHPPVNLTFHGPEVYDYTFFRIIAWRP